MKPKTCLLREVTIDISKHRKWTLMLLRIVLTETWQEYRNYSRLITTLRI